MGDIVTIDEQVFTDIADAIRSKNGTEETYKPGEMAGAISTIGNTLDDILSHNYSNIVNLTNSEITSLYPFQFAGSDITEIHAPYITDFTDHTSDNVGNGVFKSCSNLTVVDMPLLEHPNSGGYQFAYCTSLTTINLPMSYTGQSMFRGCTNLVTAVIGNSRSEAGNMNQYDFYGCTKLKNFDGNMARIYTNSFNGCTVLDTVIIRNSNVCTLSNINAFANTPFASGKSGGTLYVPEDLISSYQSASNWVTILGYTNNSIKKIEGTIYETKYADGTTISTS